MYNSIKYHHPKQNHFQSTFSTFFPHSPTPTSFTSGCYYVVCVFVLRIYVYIYVCVYIYTSISVSTYIYICLYLSSIYLSISISIYLSSTIYIMIYGFGGKLITYFFTFYYFDKNKIKSPQTPGFYTQLNN